ncbi:MAG: hypothetical protein ACKO6F_11905 [Cyanobium sp.]
MRGPLLLALGLPALLALMQQQWLLRQPPRLERLSGAAASVGPAALEARFSRPMEAASLERQSRLQPSLAHQWLGQGDRLKLALAAGQRITAPLALSLAGRDRRGLALPPQSWRWDPRPRVLAVVPSGSGEQLQLREHDGRWRPLSPVWPKLPVVEPLGDGSGVAVTSQDERGSLQVWLVPLQQRNLAPARRGLADVRPERPRPLLERGLLFAHLSANRRGQLLVQSGGMAAGDTSIRLWSGNGAPRRLKLEASGPMRLLPEGGAVVVPQREGLSLQALPPQTSPPQTLPGSRDLSAFCPRSGRALLLRHWPDYRRSLELVEPGQAQRQLWIGSQALVASACAGGGERIWALLVESSGKPQLTLLALDRQGRLLGRRLLAGRELEPGTGLHFDPSGDRLLAALRPLGRPDRPPPPARPVLIDASRLTLTPLDREVLQALWLPAE